MHQLHTLTRIKSGLLLDEQSSSGAVASPPPYGLVTFSSFTSLPPPAYINEAKYDSSHKCDNGQWPPTGIVTSVRHSICLTNDTPMPIVVKKKSHLCQVWEISCMPVTDSPPTDSNQVPSTSPSSVPPQLPAPTTPHNVCTSAPYLNISIDPDDCSTPSYRQLFYQPMRNFSQFLPQTTKSTMVNLVQ